MKATSHTTWKTFELAIVFKINLINWGNKPRLSDSSDRKQ